MTDFIETVPHEFAANFIHCDHDLTPWFGADRDVKDGGGFVVVDFKIDDECWCAKTYYQDSGIVHPGMATPRSRTVRCP